MYVVTVKSMYFLRSTAILCAVVLFLIHEASELVKSPSTATPPAYKESSVRWPRARGFCYRAGEFCMFSTCLTGK